MIIKIISDNSPSRPAVSDSAALSRWRESILLDIKSKVSPRGLKLIEEKFLKPQEWRGTANAVTKSSAIAPEDDMTIEGMANAADPDRGRELILSSAWKTANFELNPIILFNHNHNWPIGSCVEYKVEDQGLYYRACIGKPSAYSCLTETQEMCRSLLAQGILRASSVGFLPLNIEYDEENDILRYTEVELLEISVVSVPMQQGSLLDSVGPAAKNISSNAIKKEGVKVMDKAQFDEMMAKLQSVLDAVSKPKEPVNPPVNDACSEENKSLKAKVKELEASLVSLKAEKEAVEKDAEELILVLEKNGVKLEA